MSENRISEKKRSDDNTLEVHLFWSRHAKEYKQSTLSDACHFFHCTIERTWCVAMKIHTQRKQTMDLLKCIINQGKIYTAHLNWIKTESTYTNKHVLSSFEWTMVGVWIKLKPIRRALHSQTKAKESTIYVLLSHFKWCNVSGKSFQHCNELCLFDDCIAFIFQVTTVTQFLLIPFYGCRY